MSIPQQRIQPLASPVAFLGARATATIGPKLDFEDGGIALQDPSQGLLVQAWRGFIRNGAEIVIADADGAETVWITGAEISEVSITFDQNMKPTVAYVEGGIAKLNWFDIVANDQVTTVYDSSYKNPRVSLDDKHRLASATSDVIFAYLRGGALYYRQQRDRYLIEYGLASNLIGSLKRIGMNVANRFQFELVHL